MNLTVIKGRLTAEPEIKSTPSGKDVLTIGVAVDRRFKNKEGPECDFFNVVAWEGTARFISNYFHKGKEILVQGRMESRKYTDKNGVERGIWELIAENVEFCGSKNENGLASEPRQQPQETATKDSPETDLKKTAPNSDDYPF